MSRKRRKVCDEACIPEKYWNLLDGSSCFYLVEAKLVDASGCMRHLLELEPVWSGGSSRPPTTKLTLIGKLIVPYETRIPEESVPFKTLNIFDISFDFSGLLWAIGKGPNNEEYYYLILSPDKKYETYFYRLLRFKHLVLHLHDLCNKSENTPSTVQQALEMHCKWSADGGPLNMEEVAEDAAFAYKLLKDQIPVGHPILLDLERLSATLREASTEEESQTAEDVTNSLVEEPPIHSSLDMQVSPQLSQTYEEKRNDIQEKTNDCKCQMEGCSCSPRNNSKYCSDECGLLKAFLTLKRLQYC